MLGAKIQLDENLRAEFQFFRDGQRVQWDDLSRSEQLRTLYGIGACKKYYEQAVKTDEQV